MLRMVETFSGIGAQAAALRNINKRYGVEYEILNTADWDINAIIAYDLIHNGNIDLKNYDSLSKEELLKRIDDMTLSLDGKKPATEKQIQSLDISILKRLVASIERSHNLISVTDIDGRELSDEMNILTYSFPCQDLSSAGFWHGNRGGIDRNANNRSSMLWQIERILLERHNNGRVMPNFLLMENVRNVMSIRNRENFDEWRNSLVNMGYINFPLELNASDFGLPQKRKRVYMLSFYVGNDRELENNITAYLNAHDLTNNNYRNNLQIENKGINDILRLDYRNKKYKNEADYSQPNDTKSRHDIFDKNVKIYYHGQFIREPVPTLTTKQDRHPNSGVIEYKKKEGKCEFRYLTPREGFLLMGFNESDFDAVDNSNFKYDVNKEFFTRDKLNKMAGNSIAVNVLEQIFILINEINNLFYENN